MRRRATKRLSGNPHARLAAHAGSRTASQHGQASVELVSILPLVLLATLAVAQLAVVGYALWNAAAGARAGARAALVGADAVAVAERAVPDLFGADAALRGGRVRVTVRAPALVPGLPAIPLSVSGALEPGTRP